VCNPRRKLASWAIAWCSCATAGPSTRRAPAESRRAINPDAPNPHNHGRLRLRSERRPSDGAFPRTRRDALGVAPLSARMASNSFDLALITVRSGDDPRLVGCGEQSTPKDAASHGALFGVLRELQREGADIIAKAAHLGTVQVIEKCDLLHSRSSNTYQLRSQTLVAIRGPMLSLINGHYP